MYQSIATISSPEFINLKPTDINPLMSEAEIKVLYIGENRNRTLISKTVAQEMAKTLRGAPIVGYYREDKEDFRDHGQQVIIEGNEILFDCKTKPYGFVAPNAKVWFQTFEEPDKYGQPITREYLMTTGYLWTGQFEECKSVFKGDGKGQSMEIDEKTVKGQWTKDINSQIEFFIINDAIFSKLCILGDDVEPCFEGAKISAPEVSTKFNLDDNFRTTLYTMMQELKEVLEGGPDMALENEVITEVTEVTETTVEDDTLVTETASIIEETEPVAEEVSPVTEVIEENETVVSEESIVTETTDVTVEEIVTEETVVSTGEAQEQDTLQEQYDALQVAYQQLQADHAELETKYQALVDFKADIENQQKDAMINSFYMLSEEDKADVITNKANYSLEQIEEKLSVICVRKRVNFELESPAAEEIEKETAPAVTYNVTEEPMPAWIAALQNTKKSKNN